jgi:hypothetical protein
MLKINDTLFRKQVQIKGYFLEKHTFLEKISKNQTPKESF